MTDRKDRLRLADMIDRIDKACGTLAQQRAIATEGATWLELVDRDGAPRSTTGGPMGEADW